MAVRIPAYEPVCQRSEGELDQRGSFGDAVLQEYAFAALVAVDFDDELGFRGRHDDGVADDAVVGTNLRQRETVATRLEPASNF